jgi:4-amino-4-deoxy-L-arabinose transferase-like glycosyltransferase
LIDFKIIKKDFSTLYGLFFSILFLIRALLNSIIPLTDKTEARYGEIARLMAETGNWIVPQIDYGIPFWAKPPLSTWLSASSSILFGENEFALRLPYLTISMVIALLLGRYAIQKKINFFIPGIILFTLPEFFLHGGVISTDLMLSFSVALTMLGFWECIHAKNKTLWGGLFFVGIGLGLLSKGPLVGVLTIPPILIWLVRFRVSPKKILQLPWLLGILIVLIIALPWYFLMEKNSPGFIDYFVVGEHFLRFIDSSWAGDKYGFPKQQPLGIIWIFLFAGALPWSFILMGKVKGKIVTYWNDQWQLFLWLWVLWTPFFFTFSKSLIHTYTLPVMIPISLIIVSNWSTFKRKKYILTIALSLPILLFGAYFLKPTQQAISESTDKYMVQQSVNDGTILYSLLFKSYSSQFYSKGRVKVVTPEELESMINSSKIFSVIIQNRHKSQIAPEILKKLNPQIIRRKDGLYVSH